MKQELILKDNNLVLLNKRIEKYNSIKSAIVGDYLIYKGTYVRFSHDWGNSFQTSLDGSFYMNKNAYMSFSGGLNHGIKKEHLEKTKNKKDGNIWFFKNDFAEANNGKSFAIPLRVWKVKKGIVLNDCDVLGYDIKEESLKNTKEKITRLNGNGQEYKTSIPRIFIQEKLNDFTLNNIQKNTGLIFKEFGNGYIAQPQTSNDILRLLVTHNFKTQYHNGLSFENTLLLKFCGDSDFKF